MQYKILIVEDDPVIAGALERQLRRWGWDPRAAADLSQVIAEFDRFQPHLVLLDLSLPYYDGYHWCAELRKRSAVPILVLTSAGEDSAQVMALSLGSDDFVVKPFRMEVLIARIQALLRRSYGLGSDSGILRRGDLVLRLADGVVEWQGQTLELSRNESQILQCLLENAGHAVPRETLIRALWDREDFIDDNTLTVNITRLRRKLCSIGLEELILTKKGAGYLARVPS